MKSILILMDTLGGGGAEKALIDLLTHFDYTSYRITLCLLFRSGLYLNQIPKPVKVIYIYNEVQTFVRDNSEYLKFYNHQPTLEHLTLELENDYTAIISFMEGLSVRYHSFITEKTQTNISWIHCNMGDYHWTENQFNSPDSEERIYQKMNRLVFVSENARKGFNTLFANTSEQRLRIVLLFLSKIILIRIMRNNLFAHLILRFPYARIKIRIPFIQPNYHVQQTNNKKYLYSSILGNTCLNFLLSGRK